MKSSILNKKQEGFTIIEVVLVLAIAGLIFLVVFLALPQLQRSRRDSQRQSDVGRVVSALESYASNNNGQYPDDQDELDNLLDGYLTSGGSQFVDPSTGEEYDLSYGIEAIDVDDEGDGVMYYEDGMVCGDAEGEADDDDASGRNVAVIVPVENGIAYCQDNR